MSKKPATKKLYDSAAVLDSTILRLEKSVAEITDPFNDPEAEKYGLAFIHSLEVVLKNCVADFMRAGLTMEQANEQTAKMSVLLLDEIMDKGMPVFGEYSSKMFKIVTEAIRSHPGF